MSIARLLVAVLFLSAAAHADYLYSFTGPNSGDDFSFTVPSLLTGFSSSLAVTPVTVDGVTFTSAGYTESSILTCFAFAEAGSSFGLDSGGCATNPPNKVFLLLDPFVAIDAPGVYSLEHGYTTGVSMGTNELTITNEAPEPTSVILLGTLCALAGWRFRKHGRL